MARTTILITAAIALGACRQDMHDTPRYEPLEASAFFTDGGSARLPVANTVSRNPLTDTDELLYEGKINGTLGPKARPSRRSPPLSPKTARLSQPSCAP